MLLPAPMTTEAMNQSLLPSEVWIKSLSYLDTNDLHSASLVNLSFLIWSSDDSIWYEICRRRWDGKFNVHRLVLVQHIRAIYAKFTGGGKVYLSMIIQISQNGMKGDGAFVQQL